MIHSAGKVTIYLDRMGRDHESNKRVIEKLIQRLKKIAKNKEYEALEIQSITYTIHDCGEWLG